MGQLSIRNETAELLESLASLTGETEADVLQRALELYQKGLLRARSSEHVIRSIAEGIHPHIKPEFRGRAPDKGTIEQELGMP